MKSAREWHLELHKLVNTNPDWAFCKAMISDLERIQADALMEAYIIILKRAEGPVKPDCGKAADDIMELIKSLKK